MLVDSIALSDFDLFSKIDRDLNKADTKLADLLQWPASLFSFKDILLNRTYPTDRTTLVRVLLDQYQHLPSSPKVMENIHLLNDDRTFTICTAHQPSLFGGPLFVITKALSTIKLATQVQNLHPQYKIIPVFVMGAEDHDVDELNNTFLFGNKITWETNQAGPIGRFNLKEIESCIEILMNQLSHTAYGPELMDMIKAAYNPAHSFGRAFQYLLAGLFKKYGLLVLNPDHEDLKKSFSSIIQKELKESFARPLVHKTQELLASHGYEAASHARDINVFYFDDGYRDRIERNNGHFEIIGQQKTIPVQELLDQAMHQPQRFSPNVILRPVYQEIILPNLAYVGGGGELAYWIERKHLFHDLGLPFPMLVRRDSFILIENEDAQQLQQYKISIKDLDTRLDVLMNALTERWSSKNLQMNEETNHLIQWMDVIKSKTIQVDPTLGATVEGEKSKLLKSIEYIEKKLIKAEKLKQEVQLNKVKKLLDRIMPEQKLAERKENFMTYYALHGPGMLDTILTDSDPLSYQFKMISLQH